MKEKLRDEIYHLHADLCQALSDPKRILILYEFGEDRRSVSKLTNALGIRQANISQHLMASGNVAWSLVVGMGLQSITRLSTPRFFKPWIS